MGILKYFFIHNSPDKIKLYGYVHCTSPKVKKEFLRKFHVALYNIYNIRHNNTYAIQGEPDNSGVLVSLLFYYIMYVFQNPQIKSLSCTFFLF